MWSIFWFPNRKAANSYCSPLRNTKIAVQRNVSISSFNRAMHVFSPRKACNASVPLRLPKEFELVVDRVIIRKDDEDFNNRLADAIDVAFFEGAAVVKSWI